MPYGRTDGCHTPEQINMNLTGTRFSFAPHVKVFCADIQSVSEMCTWFFILYKDFIKYLHRSKCFHIGL